VAPPPPNGNGGQPKIAEPTDFTISTGRRQGAQRIVEYGPGGVGKSTLASLMPGRTLFLDIERSTLDLEVERIDSITSFSALRSVLQSSLLDPYSSIVIDSATKAEELAIAHTLATVPHEKGGRVASIEGYGFGKGYQHVYDTFLLLLADLDRIVEKGKNVVLVCHECISDVPNPAGEDFLRYEPRLQCPKSGKASIRNRVVEWADHVLFLGYDVFSEDGKGKGSGTRTIWPQERPDHIAKSRKLTEPMPWNEKTDASVWTAIIGGAA
jgi:hypothetical protein